VAGKLCVEIATGEWDFMGGRYIDATWPDLADLRTNASTIAASDWYTMRLLRPEREL
jgi:hypothetical protein